jgi:cytochrome P450
MPANSATAPAPAAPAARATAAPRPRYPGEFLLALSRDPLGLFVRLARAHGDVVRFPVAGRTFVLVAHPDLAREVLVTQQKRFVRGYAHRGLRLLLGDGLLTSEGDFHRHQRRLVQPAFHRERIARYADAMSAAAVRWSARWAAAQPPAPGAPARVVDLHAEMMALTLGIVGETLFGTAVEGVAGEVSDAMHDALAAAPLAFLPGARLSLRLPIPVATRFRRARARLHAVVARIVAERRATGGVEDRGDLLSMLLVATDPEESDGAPMADAQLRDEVLTLFLAGHETTAVALTWAWLLLSQHPEAAARLHAEVDALPGAPAFDDLARLPYARAVIAEAMRLYPPAYAVGRICAERTTLGGQTIEPGWGVITSPWLAHHDARWWPEPERFRPERWLEPAPADRPKFAYFPFGGGTRICIGEQFAWTEAILVLAVLARGWAPRVVAPEAVVPRGAITLRPVGGVRASLVARGR